MDKKLSYRDSGVDIDAGNSFVESIKNSLKKTFNSNVIGGIGSFAGAYSLPVGYKEPVLLSATDGVGTKLKLAIESKKLDSIGVDLVAMCVNDLICNFGTPMFFLDYYATGKLILEDAKRVVSGIVRGCLEAECALIGGETAEMAGLYKENDFDLAGFAVGIAEKSEIDRVSLVKPKQILVALPSSGIHSNGYSLVRKLLFEKLGMGFNDELNGEKLIDILLKPTKIYVKDFKREKENIVALAHITGGGIVENLPRVLAENTQAVVHKDKIKTLPIFDFISKYIDENEMYRTFNMGVGMVWIVDEVNVDKVLNSTGGYVIGELKKGKKEVKFL
jgi:phosphoribosylformylglycinamidine cyclo-ligase